MMFANAKAEMEHLQSVLMQLNEEIAKLEDAKELGLLSKFNATRLGALQSKRDALENRMSELEKTRMQEIAAQM